MLSGGGFCGWGVFWVGCVELVCLIGFYVSKQQVFRNPLVLYGWILFGKYVES